MSPEEKEFVQRHLSDDVRSLLLNPPKGFKYRISFLAGQILARQKAKEKLPTWYQNFEVEFPATLSVEQSSSEATAAYKSSLFSGELFIDLTGGMGIDTFAISENFKRGIYVEQNEQLANVFSKNLKILKRDLEVVNSLAQEYLQFFRESADLIFLDPARRNEHNQKVFQFKDCSPNVIEILPLIREKSSGLMIKSSPMIDLKQGILELGGVTEIHVISVRNECKEILFLLDFKTEKTENPSITTTNLEANPNQHFEFSFSEEQFQPTFADVLQFVYIPNASVLKAGAFNTVACRYNLFKLAPNTHMYTSDVRIQNFPGRAFEMLTSHPDKKLLIGEKFDLITRNYPLKPQEIVKKYKLIEGGDLTLIAFRDYKNQARMIICRLLKPAEPEE